MTDRHHLDLLRWHWGAFYEITIDGLLWHAKRRDDGSVLTTPTPTSAQLRLLLSKDYAARPVPRRGIHSTSDSG